MFYIDNLQKHQSNEDFFFIILKNVLIINKLLVSIIVYFISILFEIDSKSY